MNIVLVNPSWRLGKESVVKKVVAIYPPLGLAYIASYLRENLDVSVEIIDAYAHNLSDEEYRNKIKKIKPDIVGITAYTPTLESALICAQITRHTIPNAEIILGGPHPTLLPGDILKNEAVDIVVRGEGERTMIDLCKMKYDCRKISQVKGISYKKEEKIINNEPREPIENLDIIPFPAWDLLPIDSYRPSSGTYKRLPAMSMITSRGCPFECTYCCKPIVGASVRYRSPENIIEEIIHLSERYGVKEISFYDDSFTLNKSRLIHLCDLIVKRGLDLTWSCSTRVDLVNQSLLDKMSSAGCISICYGIESGDQNILDTMKKGITLNQARDALKWTHKAGIETRTSYIFGFPEETIETMEKTINFALELNSDFAIFNLAIPLPGTELYENAKLRGLLYYDGIELYKRSIGGCPLIKVNGISRGELMYFYKNSYRRFYLRKEYLLNRLLKIESLYDVRRYIRGGIEFVRGMI